MGGILEMNRTPEQKQALNDLCFKLPRKNNKVFQAWYYSRNECDLICVQMKRQEPRYLNLKEIPFNEIEKKVEEFLNE